jgi:hypothetical protein
VSGSSKEVICFRVEQSLVVLKNIFDMEMDHPITTLVTTHDGIVGDI